MPDVNADFARAAWLTPGDSRWVASPQPGVERVMLDRVGDEVAVATSLVRYAPRSRFPAHEHALGEEFLVLEGEFGDEHGRYPPGTYVRNPPGSRHTPFSDPGCVIWVKLRQFHSEDRRPLVASIDLPMPSRGSASRELHRFRDEAVSVVCAQRDAVLEFPVVAQVQELFVIDGEIDWGGRRLAAWGWLRVPAGEGVRVTATAPSRLLHKLRPAVAVPDRSTGATSAASAGT